MMHGPGPRGCLSPESGINCNCWHCARLLGIATRRQVLGTTATTNSTGQRLFGGIREFRAALARLEGK